MTLPASHSEADARLAERIGRALELEEVHVFWTLPRLAPAASAARAPRPELATDSEPTATPAPGPDTAAEPIAPGPTLPGPGTLVRGLIGLLGRLVAAQRR